MKKLLLTFILVLFLAGCQETKEATYTTEQGSAVGVSLSTEKELYHSNEMMKIHVDMLASNFINGAELRVYGIYAGSYRLDYKRSVDLEKGSNEADIEYRTPSCNTCSGIKAGNYDIIAELTKNGNIIGKSTKRIEIQQ